MILTSAADEGRKFYFIAKLERFLLVRLHDKSAIFTQRKTRMRMNLDDVASGHFVLGRDVLCNSGVAKLGHTGARALATRGCAPPMQALLKIIGAECTVINRELGAKSGQRC